MSPYIKEHYSLNRNPYISSPAFKNSKNKESKTCSYIYLHNHDKRCYVKSSPNQHAGNYHTYIKYLPEKQIHKFIYIAISNPHRQSRIMINLHIYIYTQNLLYMIKCKWSLLKQWNVKEILEISEYFPFPSLYPYVILLRRFNTGEASYFIFDPYPIILVDSNPGLLYCLSHFIYTTYKFYIAYIVLMCSIMMA